MLGQAMPAAAPQREPQAEARPRCGISPSLPRQRSEVARQPPRFLEAISRRQIRVRRAEPDPTAAAGPPAAPGRACKQQLGSRPKVLRGRGLVVGPCRQGSCKQQLGFGASLYPARGPAQAAPPGGVLQTTSLWFAGRLGLILQAGCRIWNTSNSALPCWIICGGATGQLAPLQASRSLLGSVPCTATRVLPSMSTPARICSTATAVASAAT